MKILVLHTGDMNMEPIVSSLCGLKDHDVKVARLTSEVIIRNPDKIVYIAVASGPLRPTIEALKKLKEFAPIVMICCDASCPDWWPLIEEYLSNECFSKIVNIDGGKNWPYAHAYHCWTGLCPIDDRYYRKDHNYGRFQSRTVHCGFAGGDGSTDRQKLIKHLGIHLVKAPRNEEYGSYKEYADFMQQCKIVINMSKCGSGKADQVKARVVEAGMAHCLLLEQKGAATSNYFEPGVDYLEYESPEHALEIIEGLYDNDATMFTYAENLHKKVTTKYSAAMFWQQVLH